MFRTVFKYIEFQDELLKISFYRSLISKAFILGFAKLSAKLLKCLTEQHLDETELVLEDLMNSMRAMKSNSVGDATIAKGLILKDLGPAYLQDFLLQKLEEPPAIISAKTDEENSNMKADSEQAAAKWNPIVIAPTENIGNESPDFLAKRRDESRERPVKEDPKLPDKKPKKPSSSPQNPKKPAGKKPKPDSKKPAKKPEKPDQTPQDKEEAKEVPKERKRFIEAGVFEADGSH